MLDENITPTSRPHRPKFWEYKASPIQEWEHAVADFPSAFQSWPPPSRKSLTRNTAETRHSFAASTTSMAFAAPELLFPFFCDGLFRGNCGNCFSFEEIGNQFHEL